MRIRYSVLISIVLMFLSVNCNNKESNASAVSASNTSKANKEVSTSNSPLSPGETISINGSSTVYPFVDEIAMDFQKKFPTIKITVDFKGTGGGFELFCSGKTAISNASRPIKTKEIEACSANKIEFVEIPLAYDGLSIVVHPENNWITDLSVDQLNKIWGAEQADKMKFWSDVNPGWPKEPIKLFAPGSYSGTHDYFSEVVFEHGKRGKMRADISENEDDDVIVRGVASNKFSMGFFGFSYFIKNKELLKSVPIVNKKGDKVSPSYETINDGSYNPFSRPLFIYINKEKLNNPTVKNFVDYLLDHVKEATAKKGFGNLPDDLFQSIRQHYEKRNVGTKFAEGTTGTLKDRFTIGG